MGINFSLSVHITESQLSDVVRDESSGRSRLAQDFLRYVRRILKIKICNGLPKKPHPKRMKQFPHPFYKSD